MSPLLGLFQTCLLLLHLLFKLLSIIFFLFCYTTKQPVSTGITYFIHIFIKKEDKTTVAMLSFATNSLAIWNLEQSDSIPSHKLTSVEFIMHKATMSLAKI
jgi:hypothetical protein